MQLIIQKAYEEQVETIEYAAKRWVADNGKTVPTSTFYKTVNCLKKQGYLASNKDITNPINKNVMNGCVVVTYDTAHKQYVYKYQDSCPGSDSCS